MGTIFSAYFRYVDFITFKQKISPPTILHIVCSLQEMEDRRNNSDRGLKIGFHILVAEMP